MGHGDSVLVTLLTLLLFPLFHCLPTIASLLLFFSSSLSGCYCRWGKRDEEAVLEIMWASLDPAVLPTSSTCSILPRHKPCGSASQIILLELIANKHVPEITSQLPSNRWLSVKAEVVLAWRGEQTMESSRKVTSQQPCHWSAYHSIIILIDKALH